ncbi:DMSO reductase iron-sulfur subunit [Slackia heliotrinireducens]|uniref:Fe-S-cluster-containing hydrogenase subunit n=1 Tax=Slackia heliotrinireducens (strain ATCC 29202 / DSM 20476 / NCTC 11029 / RHS 1) TaxID=471855 RepID=C7N429_SLAHD|nr:4Fe-4S dicluster domain-containing protein [Slackia heliotrinireducens]ACV23765.1 Fe-S-cluster-containing hydrogenase subunit [Slackia heliotrinireducens DSM 20476]VEH03395.1 DMSO reductase iron-sulfur subunit [Slackia heliotrinireducens]
MTKLAIGIKLERCIGCQTCAFSCKMQNNVPDGMLWNRVISEGADNEDGSVGTYPNVSRTYLPLACQHCENPACQKVCPTGATYKDEMGRVEIDYQKCIGCRMCMAACPFNARVFNWVKPERATGFDYGDAEVPARKKGVMEKCTLCKERTDRGENPMCVECCPARARVFGDLDDPESEISKLRASGNVRILLEEKGTRPQVFYVK